MELTFQNHLFNALCEITSGRNVRQYFPSYQTVLDEYHAHRCGNQSTVVRQKGIRAHLRGASLGARLSEVEYRPTTVLVMARVRQNGESSLTNSEISKGGGSHRHGPLMMQGGAWSQGAGFRVQGSGFRVQSSGLRIQSSGFRVQDAGFGVQDLGFRFQG